MALKQRIVEIPAGAFIYKSGYVYVTVNSKYDASVKYTRSTRKCVGKSIDGKTMYENENFSLLYGPLADASERSDAISVGVYLLISKVCETSLLNTSLSEVFADSDARQIKDLASYMLITESDAFQHYPAYGFSNALFSKNMNSDSSICRFLQSEIQSGHIQHFLDVWSKAHYGSGKAYLCYDSTNINSVAEGVELAQMGHAKDDPTKPQVNLEYVVRQEDGLPLLYKDYPGSIVDITAGSDMIAEIHKLGYHDITVICDRGYISEENIRIFDKNGLHFLLMLRVNMAVCQELIQEYGKKIRLHSEYYLPNQDLYGLTVKRELYGRERSFHLFWTQAGAEEGRWKIMKEVERMEAELRSICSKKRSVTKEEEKRFSKWFVLAFCENSILESFCRDYSKIDNAVNKEGYFLLLSSECLTCQSAIEAYSKRDCVEKTFRTLKSNLGMDSIRTHTDTSTRSKLFIAFIASIIRSVIFFHLKPLRTKDKKNYTVPAALHELAKIEALRDYKTGKYSRRYKLTSKQKRILSAFSLVESDVDSVASTL